MGLTIFSTDDGSQSIYNDDLDEVYHSKHGAVNESLHVFNSTEKRLQAKLSPYSESLNNDFNKTLNKWIEPTRISLHENLWSYNILYKSSGWVDRRL